MNKKSTNVPLLASAPKKLSQRNNEEEESLAACCCVLITTLFLIALVTLLIDDGHPRVALETIALSLHDDYTNVTNGTTTTTANWDVTVSIENRYKLSRLRFGEVSVWVDYMSKSSSLAVIPAFELGVRDARVVNGTVKSSLTDHARDRLVNGSAVDVLVKGEYGHRFLPTRAVKFACRDVGVGVLSGATRERKYCTALRKFDPSNLCFLIYAGRNIWIPMCPWRYVGFNSSNNVDLESEQKINK